jgi:WhiB family redox-sensing transcriptional regulator
MIYFTDEEFEAAACKSVGTEAYYVDDRANAMAVRALKTVCSSCEIIGKCLEVALANNEMYGVWGGMSESERKALKRNLNRAASRV